MIDAKLAEQSIRGMMETFSCTREQAINHIEGTTKIRWYCPNPACRKHYQEHDDSACAFRSYTIEFDGEVNIEWFSVGGAQ